MSLHEHIYSYTRTYIERRYSAFIEGPLSSLFLVICGHALGNPARKALHSTAISLGWEEGATFVYVDSDKFDTSEVFGIIEGLDPICLVVEGDAARTYLEQAYRQELPSQGRFRLFGREACTLKQLDTLLENEQGKQVAWGLLRSLPKAPQ